MKKTILITLMLLTSLPLSWAQKYGHLNLGNLVAAIPATKVADSEIKTFSDQLIAQGEQRADKLKADYAAVIQRIQGGQMSPVEQEAAEKRITAEQTKLQAFEQEVQQKIAAKRQTLLKPIFDRVEKAIQEVAKAKGITMVFDTSMFNTVMYASDATDLMADVKAKLGVK
jgi:outer membrane protein